MNTIKEIAAKEIAYFKQVTSVAELLLQSFADGKTHEETAEMISRMYSPLIYAQGSALASAYTKIREQGLAAETLAEVLFGKRH